MKKQNQKWIWIVGILIVFIIFNPLKKESGWANESSLSTCLTTIETNIERGDVFVSPCYLVNTAVVTCVSDPNEVDSSFIGDYIRVYDSNSARDTFDPIDESVLSCLEDNSVSNCPTGYSVQTDGSCGISSTTCDNIADTNTDCEITLSELIVYAEQWVANSGVTLTQLINTAEIWVAGGSY